MTEWAYDYYDATEQFERDAAEHVTGLTATDVGGVIIYTDTAGTERVLFDYENAVGWLVDTASTAATLCAQ